MNRDLREELLRRSDLDQAARSEVASGGEAAFRRVLAIDDDNAAWLAEVVDKTGWPGRSLTGEEGAHAAWLLAQHADRYPALQRRCLRLLKRAVATGEASATDLAHLTDRALLAGGKAQVYGTQLIARHGRFVARRLRHPETVDQRRAAAGLEPLQVSLERALQMYGPPEQPTVPCKACHQEIKVRLPEPGDRLTVNCPACQSRMTIRLRVGSISGVPA
jgi:hypothetical protein